MNKTLQEMFQKSTFSVLDQKYIMATVRSYPKDTTHFMVSQDDKEITVITEESKVPELEIVERNQHSWFVVSVGLS